MHLSRHFLFIIGTPALLVLLVAGAGLYRSASLEEDPQDATLTTIQNEDVTSHVVHEEGGESVGEARVQAPSQITSVPTPAPHAAPMTDDLGIHFSGTLQKVDTGCFSDGECFVVVDGKHVTALRGWSQEVVGTVQGVDGFGDLAGHIGAQVEVFAFGAGDGVYTLYGNDKLYIRLATSSTPATQSASPAHISSQRERPEVH